MRCPDCASMRSSTLYKVSPLRLVLAIVVGIAAGTVGAAILFVTGFFVFFIGPTYGLIVAEIVLRVTGRKRGILIESIGVGSIVVGALIAIGYSVMTDMRAAALAGAHIGFGVMLQSIVGAIVWPLIGIVLAISSCFSKIRYF
jgi:hypothetical protein